MHGKKLSSQGTPVEKIEGDGDTTLIARPKIECGLSVVKDWTKITVKPVYKLHNLNVVKISNQVISHLSKCIKYMFAKNQGDGEGNGRKFGSISLLTIAMEGFGNINVNQMKHIHRKLLY